jgi:peptidoglycan/LPS O-acetylase OafA/YrhL
VYLVVLFHAGSVRFGGGFIGVDVFFVLSGFLVTQLLVRDINAVGSIRYGRFYSRRFRRLLPAAFATLVITAVVYAAIASPIQVGDAVGAFKAAFLYVTNWYFIAQSTGYFGANVSSNPVLHFWSLAVEEQFYLLWPLILSALYIGARRFGRRQWPIVRLLVAGGALASLVWAWFLRGTNPNRAYYGTDARAYQLLAGALLALSPALIARLRHSHLIARWMGVVGLGGLLLAATSWAHIDAIHRGTLATILTVMVIGSMEATNGGPVGRLLSRQPLTYLGKISYGTYLWHWPVIVVLTIVAQPTTFATIALTVLVATGLASLSYQVLEQPIRVSAVLDRHRRSVVAVGLATSIIAAVLIIPAITKHGTASTAVAAPSVTDLGYTPVPTEDWQAIKNDQPELPNCFNQPPDSCILIRGTGAHVLVIGDSHAGMMLPAFRAIAESDHLTLSASIQGRCPWPLDLDLVPYEVGSDPNWSENCKKEKQDLYDRVIPALHPDVIIAMNNGYEKPGKHAVYLVPGQKDASRTSPEFNAWIEQTTKSSLARLEERGRKVVLIEPIPYSSANFDPLPCLAKAHVVEECRYIANAQPSTLELLYRSLDHQDDHLWSLNLDHIVCPFMPICDPIVRNEVVKIDATHLASGFVRSVAPDIDKFLKLNGIISQ